MSKLRQNLRSLINRAVCRGEYNKTTLDKLDFIRKQVTEWQAENNIESENSVDTLNRLRAECDKELANENEHS